MFGSPATRGRDKELKLLGTVYRCSMLHRLAILSLALPTAPLLADTAAAKMWEQNCASCHGDNGGGNSASSLLDEEWTTDGTDRGLYDSIEGGLQHLGMPAYGEAFTPAEVWSQVVLIREFRAEAQREEHPAAEAEKGTGSIEEGTGVYDTRHARFRLEEVPVEADELSGGFERPWAIDFLPDGRPLITERAGTLYVAEDPEDPASLREVTGTPQVWEHGQGGLLDVAVDPAYEQNGWIYLSFSQKSGEHDGKAVGNTAFVRGKIREEGGKLRWTDEQLLHRPDEGDDGPQGVHFGSRFAFDGDGHVFLVLGERGRNEASLEADNAWGKILRLNKDGSTPADGQPFSSDPEAVRGLWTLGHRNPQALLFQPGTDRLYAVEHGPRGGDELNLIEPGNSHGWSKRSYSINYNGTPRGDNPPWHEEAGYTEPVFYWIPSLAPCGAAFYTGDSLGDWGARDLFVTSLVDQELHRLRLADDGKSVTEHEVLLRGIGRLRDVATGPDGALWVVAEKPGRVFRLTPAD